MPHIPVNAANRRKLKQFILDLCAYTLNNKGYKHESYAFYLNLAFQRQITLAGDKWLELYSSFNDLSLNDENFLAAATTLAQRIVNEVLETRNDNLAVKLVKNSYIANLQQAKKSSDAAYRYLNPKISVDESLFYVVPTGEKEALTNLLYAHIDYLTTLNNLPFELETLIPILMSDTGYNYTPLNEAKFLSMSLSIINQAFIAGEEHQESIMVKGAKLVLAMLQPAVGLDENTINAFNNQFYKFCNEALKKYHAFNGRYNEFFSAAPEHQAQTLARKALMGSLNVQFSGINDILTNTLLAPAAEITNLAVDASEALTALTRAAVADNSIDGMLDVSKAFHFFDRMATSVGNQDQTLIPSWFQNANQYYGELQQITAVVSGAAASALNGLGDFYNYAVSFIPSSITYYFRQADRVKDTLNVQHDICDVVLVYIAFFELIQNSGIKDELLKEQFFHAYINDVSKTEGLKALENRFNFQTYLGFENQLINKDHLSMSLSLSARLALQERLTNTPIIDLSQSEYDNNANLGLENLGQLNLILMINELQNLESNFSLDNAISTFQELSAILEARNKHELFNTNFLIPAFNRLMLQYQQRYIIPALESIIDSQEVTAHSHHAVPLYSKLKINTPWSIDDWSHFNSCIRASSEVNKSALTRFSAVILGLPEKLVNHETLTVESVLTPNQLLHQATKKTVKLIAEPINATFAGMHSWLDLQLKHCRTLITLTSDIALQELCKLKIEYIETISRLLNIITRSLANPNTVAEDIEHLLQIDVPAELAQKLSASNLVDFTIKSLPTVLRYEEFTSTDLVIKILFKYKNDFPLIELLETQDRYSRALEQNPLPALMNELCDPLSFSQVGLAQERIMDAIFSQLLSIAEKSVVTWGVNHLVNAANKITKAGLVKLLPYPVLAELAMEVIGSKAIQDCLSNAFNTLVNQYGSTLKDHKAACEEQLKKVLYPILGVQVQKTLEEAAYGYTVNAVSTNVQRDAIALFYLKFLEIKKKGTGSNDEAIIEFLFSALLKGKTLEEKEVIIHNIELNFQNFSDLINPSANTHVQLFDFILSHINEHPQDENNNLMLTAIFNQLVLLNAKIPSLKLQSDAIEKLSDAFTTIDNLVEREPEADFAYLISPKQLLNEALGEANTKAEQVILQHIKKTSADLAKVMEAQLTDCEKLLNKNSAPYTLGYTLAEHKYYNSTPENLVYRLALNVLNVVSFISLWGSIIAPILSGAGIIQGLVTGLGIVGAVGSSATGVGAIGLAAAFAVRIAIKFGTQIYVNRNELRALKDKPLSDKMLTGGTILLKSFGVALFQTFFTDFLAVKISDLLFIAPIKRLRESLRRWPGRTRVQAEQVSLQRVQVANNALEALLKNPEADLKEIQQLSTQLNVVLITNRALIRVENEPGAKLREKTDARYIKSPNFKQNLLSTSELTTKMSSQVDQLTKIITQKEKLASFYPKVPLAPVRNVADNNVQVVPKKAADTVTVNIIEYKNQLNPEAANQGNFISGITQPLYNWWYSRPSPAPELTRDPISLNDSFVDLSDSLLSSVLDYEQEHSEFELMFENERPQQVEPADPRVHSLIDNDPDVGVSVLDYEQEHGQFELMFENGKPQETDPTDPLFHSFMDSKQEASEADPTESVQPNEMVQSVLDYEKEKNEFVFMSNDEELAADPQHEALAQSLFDNRGVNDAWLALGLFGEKKPEPADSSDPLERSQVAL